MILAPTYCTPTKQGRSFLWGFCPERCLSPVVFAFAKFCQFDFMDQFQRVAMRQVLLMTQGLCGTSNQAWGFSPLN